MNHHSVKPIDESKFPYHLMGKLVNESKSGTPSFSVKRKRKQNQYKKSTEIYSTPKNGQNECIRKKKNKDLKYHSECIQSIVSNETHKSNRSRHNCSLETKGKKNKVKIQNNHLAASAICNDYLSKKLNSVDGLPKTNSEQSILSDKGDSDVFFFDLSGNKISCSSNSKTEIQNNGSILSLSPQDVVSLRKNKQKHEKGNIIKQKLNNDVNSNHSDNFVDIRDSDCEMTVTRVDSLSEMEIQNYSKSFSENETIEENSNQKNKKKVHCENKANKSKSKETNVKRAFDFEKSFETLLEYYTAQSTPIQSEDEDHIQSNCGEIPKMKILDGSDRDKICDTKKSKEVDLETKKKHKRRRSNSGDRIQLSTSSSDEHKEGEKGSDISLNIKRKKRKSAHNIQQSEPDIIFSNNEICTAEHNNVDSSQSQLIKNHSKPAKKKRKEHVEHGLLSILFENLEIDTETGKNHNKKQNNDSKFGIKLDLNNSHKETAVDDMSSEIIKTSTGEESVLQRNYDEQVLYSQKSNKFKGKKQKHRQSKCIDGAELKYKSENDSVDEVFSTDNITEQRIETPTNKNEYCKSKFIGDSLFKNELEIESSESELNISNFSSQKKRRHKEINTANLISPNLQEPDEEILKSPDSTRINYTEKNRVAGSTGHGEFKDECKIEFSESELDLSYLFSERKSKCRDHNSVLDVVSIVNDEEIISAEPNNDWGLKENSHTKSNIRKKKKHKADSSLEGLFNVPEEETPMKIQNVSSIENGEQSSSVELSKDPELEENSQIKSKIRKKKKHRVDSLLDDFSNVAEENITKIWDMLSIGNGEKSISLELSEDQELGESSQIKSKIRKKKKHKADSSSDDLSNIAEENATTKIRDGSSTGNSEKSMYLELSEDLEFEENSQIKSKIRKKKKHKADSSFDDLSNIAGANTPTEIRDVSSIENGEKSISLELSEDQELGESSQIKSKIRKKKKHKADSSFDDLSNIAGANTPTEIRDVSSIENGKKSISLELSEDQELGESSQIKSKIRKKKKHKADSSSDDLSNIAEENATTKIRDGSSTGNSEKSMYLELSEDLEFEENSQIKSKIRKKKKHKAHSSSDDLSNIAEENATTKIRHVSSTGNGEKSIPLELSEDLELEENSRIKSKIRKKRKRKGDSSFDDLSNIAGANTPTEIRDVSSIENGEKSISLKLREDRELEENSQIKSKMRKKKKHKADNSLEELLNVAGERTPIKRNNDTLELNCYEDLHSRHKTGASETSLSHLFEKKKKNRKHGNNLDSSQQSIEKWLKLRKPDSIHVSNCENNKLINEMTTSPISKCDRLSKKESDSRIEHHKNIEKSNNTVHKRDWNIESPDIKEELDVSNNELINFNNSESSEFDSERNWCRNIRKINKNIRSHIESENDGAEVLKNLNIVLPFTVPPLHVNLERPSKPTLNELNVSKKFNVKLGAYSQEEDQIIKNNWERFRKEHDLNIEPSALFKFPSKMKTEEKVKFLQYISHGLDNRLPHRVHYRFKVLFGNMVKKTGRFTEEEDKQILEFMEMESSKTPFIDLARILNRTSNSIERHYKRLHDKQKLVWTPSKADELINCMLKVVKLEKPEQLKDYKFTTKQWKKISKKMKGIPVIKLQRAWNITIYPRLFAIGNLTLAKKMIIDILDEQQETDWRLIDWKEISKKFPGFSSEKLYMMFKKLVIFNVPKRLQKDVRKCIECLKGKRIATPHKFRKYEYRNGHLVYEDASEDDDNIKI